MLITISRAGGTEPPIANAYKKDWWYGFTNAGPHLQGPTKESLAPQLKPSVVLNSSRNEGVLLVEIESLEKLIIDVGPVIVYPARQAEIFYGAKFEVIIYDSYVE